MEIEMKVKMEIEMSIKYININYGSYYQLVF